MVDVAGNARTSWLPSRFSQGQRNCFDLQGPLVAGKSLATTRWAICLNVDVPMDVLHALFPSLVIVLQLWQAELV